LLSSSPDLHSECNTPTNGVHIPAHGGYPVPTLSQSDRESENIYKIPCGSCRCFPAVLLFWFCSPFHLPHKAKYTLRIYHSIRQANTQRVNSIYIKRLCQIPDTQERVAFLIPQTVYSHPSQSPASAPTAAARTSATAAPSHQHSGQMPHYISDHHKLCSIGRSDRKSVVKGK